MLLNADSALEDKQFSSYAHRKATMGKVLTPLGKVLASSLMSHTKSGASESGKRGVRRLVFTQENYLKMGWIRKLVCSEAVGCRCEFTDKRKVRFVQILSTIKLGIHADFGCDRDFIWSDLVWSGYTI